MQEKAQGINLTPLPMPKRVVPVQISPKDENFPAENKESIREREREFCSEKKLTMWKENILLFKKIDENS